MSSPAAGDANKSLFAFGKKERKTLFDPMFDNNPITVQVLGVCSALAVTVQINRAIVMGLAVMAVLIFSNVVISAMRKTIPSSIRIIIMLAVIASAVIIVDQVLQAYLFDISKSLSVFVGLIITNCILLGRAEAFALANPPWQSFLDAVGNGLGYGLILVSVAALRELFGSGTFFGFQILPGALYDFGYMNNGLMLLAPGAFILLGLFVWAQRTITGYRE